MKKQKYAMPEIGKTYKFAGYDWTACEVDNDRHTAVIQSHGVTHGDWPGYAMQKFGGKADTFYALDIDGEDISAYDDKMYALYKSIIDVEDTSASYGIGLYLVSADKAGFTELGKLGSGNYCQALKTAATNFSSFGFPYYHAWLGTVSGSVGAWYVYSNGYIYSYQNNDFVVAPAFNLDLSKVEIVENEIVIKEISENKNAGKTKKNGIKKARLILAVTDQVTEDGFERHYKTVEIEVPENEHIDLSKCDIIGGEWIS